MEEVCDARIGMCVHVSVPLMHGRSRCVVPAVGIVAVVAAHVAAVGASDQSHRPSCCRSSCDKRNVRHTKATPAVLIEASQSKSSCGVHVQRTFCCFSPALSLWHLEECVEAGRDGWMEGGGFPALRVSLPVYLESLLMTRISAPFSSLRRWLSALKSTRTFSSSSSSAIRRSNILRSFLSRSSKAEQSVKRSCL